MPDTDDVQFVIVPWDTFLEYDDGIDASDLGTKVMLTMAMAQLTTLTGKEPEEVWADLITLAVASAEHTGGYAGG